MLPKDTLRALQLKKFKNALNWAYHHSAFYRKIYDEAGMKPGDIKTLEDVRLVPTVEKDMLGAQEHHPTPYGDILSVPLGEIAAFRQTSGTTGTPVYHAETWRDLEWYSETWAYVLYAQGFRYTDRVFIPFGYNIFVAFWGGHYGAEKIGCEDKSWIPH